MSTSTRYVAIVTRNPRTGLSYRSIRNRDRLELFRRCCAEQGVEVVSVDDAPEAKRESSRFYKVTP